jgi:hypothetical protein
MFPVHAPEGPKKIARGKRSAAPGNNGFKQSPGRGERQAFFRPCRGSDPRLSTGGLALRACPRLFSWAPPGLGALKRPLESRPYKSAGLEKLKL